MVMMMVMVMGIDKINRWIVRSKHTDRRDSHGDDTDKWLLVTYLFALGFNGFVDTTNDLIHLLFGIHITIAVFLGMQ